MMKKKMIWRVLITLVLSSVFMSGCAKQHFPFETKNMTSLAPLKIVYYGEPSKMGVKNPYGRMASSGVAILISPIIGLAGETGIYLWEIGKEKDIYKANIPDLGQLVMKTFVERAPREVANWPTMTVDEKPFNRDDVNNFIKNKSGSILIFQIARTIENVRGAGFLPVFASLKSYPIYELNAHNGLVATIRTVLQDPEGKIVWAKYSKYSSRIFGRNMNFNEYLADDYRLLREEIEFAANTIVSELIDNLLKGL